MKNIIKKLKDIILKILSEPWFMYNYKPPIRNEKWRIHKCDADQNFPSIPHLDCITDTRKKMNIYTGEIYIRGNDKSIDKATKKELKRLWSDVEFREIVYAERIRYLEKYKKEVKEDIPIDYKEEYIKYKNTKSN